MDHLTAMTCQKILIDENVLKDLKKIMDDEFIEVLQLFLEDSISLMSDIHAGFSSESELLLHAVQTLKSSSINVGAMRLAEINEKIEAFVKAGEIDSARTYLDELQEIYTHTHGRIKKYTQGDLDSLDI
jgi:HPt (histidine-containing phosphotransfer) domain-containing protein